LVEDFIILYILSIDTRLINTAIVYICKNCNNVLLVFDRPGHEYGTIPSPSDLKYRYQIIRCPRCGAEINMGKIDHIHSITILRRGEALKIYKR